MPKKGRRDLIGLGTMLVVLLVLFGLLVSEAAVGNWFTAIMLGIPMVPCIVGVGGLLVYSLRHEPGDADTGQQGYRPKSK